MSHIDYSNFLEAIVNGYIVSSPLMKKKPSCLTHIPILKEVSPGAESNEPIDQLAESRCDEQNQENESKSKLPNVDEEIKVENLTEKLTENLTKNHTERKQYKRFRGDEHKRIMDSIEELNVSIFLNAEIDRIS